MSSSDEKCHSCDFCTLKLENYHLLCEHLHLIHNIVLIQCEYCQLEFPSKSEVDKHVKSQHTHDGNSRVECSICPGTYLTVRGLKRHMKQKHSGETEIFCCEKCDKTYIHRTSLLKHLKVSHRPLKYMKCNMCPKMFYKKQTLVMHKLVEHTQGYMRPKCPLCPKTFKYRAYLSTHLRDRHYSSTLEHKKQKSDFKCYICAEVFNNKVSWLEHRKHFHNRQINIFSCNRCNAVFKLHEAFENHLWNEHKIMTRTNIQKESHNYVIPEFVDFEKTMMWNLEFRQLIKIRQSVKSNQKLAIVSYNPRLCDEPNDSLDVEESDLTTIQQNVNKFFSSLLQRHCGNNKNYVESNTHDDTDHSVENVYSENNDIENEDNENNNIEKEDNRLDNVDMSSGATIAKEIATIKFSCMECSQMFHTKDILLSHLRTVHGKEIINKTINDNKANMLQKEVEPNSSRIRKKAKIIGKKSNKKSKIDKNRNKNEDTFNHKIVEKNKDIAKKSSNHVKNTAPYICSTCDRRFKIKIALLSHEKIHSSIALEEQKLCDNVENVISAMFPCQHCQALFPCIELLQNHISWQHTNY